EDGMTEILLTRLLRAVLGVTRVDRIYAFDTGAHLVEHVMVDPKAPAEPNITDFMRSLVSKALTSRQLVLSNNTFTDPSQAPTTNIGINNLRIYVVLPVPEVGVLFLDQPIGVGVVPRQTIDRLFNTLQDIASQPDAADLSDEHIAQRFALA
ncbi:MAG: hypothetical protein MUC99_12370, partial [Anaerolineae bacterium]|nr:hypothetical protein [Anaerolineae bacterium]